MLDELVGHLACASIENRLALAARLQANVAREIGFLGHDEPDDALPRRLRGAGGRRKVLDKIIWVTRPVGRPPQAAGFWLRPKYVGPGETEPELVKHLSLCRALVAHWRALNVCGGTSFARHLDEALAPYLAAELEATRKREKKATRSAIELQDRVGSAERLWADARVLLEEAFRAIAPDLSDRRRRERGLAVRTLAVLANVELGTVETLLWNARKERNALVGHVDRWGDPHELIAPPAAPGAPRVHVRYEALEAGAPRCCRLRQRWSGHQEDYATAERRRADELEADRRRRRVLLERSREGTPKERMRNILREMESMYRSRSGRTDM